VRLALGFIVILTLLSPAYGQSGGDPEHIIRRIVDEGVIEGHDQKVIGSLGDAGAVLVTKVLAGRDLTSSTIDNTLIVIDGIFADPRFVAAASDKQPRTALLVLRYLDLSTNDAALRKRIADAGRYVHDRYAASLQAEKQ
jgi:hypothetical protein